MTRKREDKASSCEDCKYWRFQKKCIKGHKPKFYEKSHTCDDWGWKRLCSDFKQEVEDVKRK